MSTTTISGWNVRTGNFGTLHDDRTFRTSLGEAVPVRASDTFVSDATMRHLDSVDRDQTGETPDVGIRRMAGHVSPTTLRRTLDIAASRIEAGTAAKTRTQRAIKEMTWEDLFSHSAFGANTRGITKENLF